MALVSVLAKGLLQSTKDSPVEINFFRRNLNMQIKEQLKYHMNLRDISASELARRSKVPKQRISDWLGGVVPKNLKMLKRVASTLEISMDELCFGKSNKQADINEFHEEINAGVFEVILRKVKK